jgi:hypothetical protein
MDIEAIAGLQSPVDEERVQGDVERYVRGEPEGAPWRIASIGQADWCMQRLADIQRRVVQYTDEIALWQAALRNVQAASDWFQDRLMEWGVEQRTAARKTFPLAHGTVRTTEHKARMQVDDEKAALEWAKVACPAAVQVREKFLISEVGTAAHVTACVVGYKATNKASGEYERIPIKQPYPFDEVTLAQIADRLGDGFVVEAEMEDFVLDGEGNVVPGLSVRPGSITASVTPLM